MRSPSFSLLRVTAMLFAVIACIVLASHLVAENSAQPGAVANTAASKATNKDPWSDLTQKNPFSVHGFAGQPSIDTGPVYIRFINPFWTYGPSHFDLMIPRNTLFFLTKDNKDRQDIRVELHYPEFSGATEETFTEFDFRSFKLQPNIIMIWILYPHGNSSEQLIDATHNIIAWDDASEKHKTLYGLNISNHNKVYPSETYFADDPAVGQVAVTCDSPKQDFYVNDPSCLDQFISQDGLSVYSRYNKELLPYWRDIHQHVIDFVHSIVRKG